MEDTNVNDSQNQKKKSNRVLYLIGKIILILIIISLIVISVRALIFKKYDVFGYRCYLIMSGSMEPTINVSDLVITKESNDLNKGDIIAFYNKGVITVHRIIEEYNEENVKKYKTKGDNNNSEDSDLVSQSQIKGEVIGKIPKVGDIIIFLRKYAVIMLILALGIYVIVYLIRRLI